MKFAVRISDSADADLAGISRWIQERGSAQAADRWDSELRDSIASLEILPGRCPLAPESKRGRIAAIHQLLAGAYRILFAVEGRTVVILHVRHAQRGSVRAEDLKDRLRRAFDAAE